MYIKRYCQSQNKSYSYFNPCAIELGGPQLDWLRKVLLTAGEAGRWHERTG